MLIAYFDKNKFVPQIINDTNQQELREALWIDILSPTKEEEALIEKSLNLGIPTREEMLEIEISSRLYKDNETLFLTATMIAQSDSSDPQSDAVTFILAQHQLLTIRYIEPHSFKLFINHLQKLHTHYTNPADFLVDLLDATIDRLADILELVGHRLDNYSRSIFRNQTINNLTKKLNHQEMLLQIGADGDLNTKARESLVSFNRLIAFLSQNLDGQAISINNSKLLILGKDITALSDHVNFLSSKVSFLLDATLGMVNIEQTNIIKILSVAATIFLPPTLIASIYGMNFKFIPELDWHWGYFVAVSMMFLSAWLPFKYFKRRKWL